MLGDMCAVAPIPRNSNFGSSEKGVEGYSTPCRWTMLFSSSLCLTFRRVSPEMARSVSCPSTVSACNAKVSHQLQCSLLVVAHDW